MTGRLLILDAVPTNRIVLKVKLSAAFYHVMQASTLSEAQLLIGRNRPDLILIGSSGTSLFGALAQCKALHDLSSNARIPILMIAEQVTDGLRNAALRAGADHVFAKPVDESVLLARIRALLRQHEGADELALRTRTSPALGFSETKQTPFEATSRVVVATAETQVALSWATRLKALVPYHLSPKPMREALRGVEAHSVPDCFVIGLSASQPQEGLRLLAEIRARTATRKCGVLVLVPREAETSQIDALDLGASDVMCDGFDPEEMALRLDRILSRKRFRDGMRRNLREGLEAAVTDPLTGLYNRRFALPHLERVAEFSRRSQSNFSVMVADLDHFKAINDRYGHSAGDAVLECVAKRLRSGLRPVDLLARIGGEEFLIVQPATGREEALDTAARLCRLIGDAPVTIKKKDLRLPVTISIGVAMACDLDPTEGARGAALIEAADHALYRAKETGRNQVLLTPPAEGAWPKAAIGSQ